MVPVPVTVPVTVTVTVAGKHLKRRKTMDNDIAQVFDPTVLSDAQALLDRVQGLLKGLK